MIATSPDCSGNPFMQCNGIKDCSEKRETAPKKLCNFATFNLQLQYENRHYYLITRIAAQPF